ncbi:nuclear-pore anchor-like [Arachis stenosperma]|uniref:nuclear-pore anchor-like n=1 Tax=Arachis stenosperma TaxID=217475 RepID=UPI0025ACF24C|nr:nuclear-pore anchor-like [Arachis stenosperma]
MPLFLSDEEFGQCDAATVAAKADAYIRGLLQELDTLGSRVDTAIINAQQNCSLLKLYLFLLQKNDSNIIALKSRVSELESRLEQRNLKIADLQQEHQVQLQVKIADLQQEHQVQLQVLKDQLQDLEKKLKEKEGSESEGSKEESELEGSEPKVEEEPATIPARPRGRPPIRRGLGPGRPRKWPQTSNDV